MRLIDADKLEKEICKWLNPSAYIDEPNMVEVDDIAISIIQTIDEQPIAYDVDKVVKQLEDDERHTFDGCINKKYAIEIVKAGGIDE